MLQMIFGGAALRRNPAAAQSTRDVLDAADACCGCKL
jgi:hypothetical protein